MSDSRDLRHIVLWSSDETLAERIAAVGGDRFTVSVQSDSESACRELAESEPAALLADPELDRTGSKGFLRAARRMRPDLPVALVHPVEESHTFHYLRMYAASGALGPRATLSDRALLHFLDHLTRREPDFGLERHMGVDEAVHRQRLKSPGARNTLLSRVVRSFETHCHVERHDLQLVYEETLNNAIFHAFRTESNESKYHTHGDTPFDADEELEVQWASGEDMGALAVIDNQGLLSPDVVWDRFFRQTSLRGLLDTNGRGLYLAHLLSQLLLVTVVPGIRTQITTLFLPHEAAEGRAVCFRVFPQ